MCYLKDTTLLLSRLTRLLGGYGGILIGIVSRKGMSVFCYAFVFDGRMGLNFLTIFERDCGIYFHEGVLRSRQLF